MRIEAQHITYRRLASEIVQDMMSLNPATATARHEMSRLVTGTST
jgi:hypothetical protein